MMDSFKHIISYACDKNCSYCINEILVHDEKQCKNKLQIADAYQEMALRGYDHIMLSGGEPVLNKMFEPCIKLADMIFDKITIITAHNNALSSTLIEEYADDVLFSFHAEYMEGVTDKKVSVDTPFYASMVVEGYEKLKEVTAFPLYWLEKQGFAGATVREAYPDGIPLPKSFHYPEGFSFRTHVKENCTKDSLLLLPDLSLSSEGEFNSN